MKELSIEQKAQRYEKALKVAKSNYETIVQMDKDCTFAKEGIVNTFHHMFPELKESEDERIRKDIERAISVALDYSCFDKETANNCLAWIEKQGEYANFRNKIQIGDKVTRNEDGVLVNLSQLNRVAKPADKVEPKFKVGDWVVNNNGEPQFYQVTERSWPDSKIKKAEDNLESFINTATLDKQYHLWTIQDAKAGDLLADDYGIYIFDRFDEYDEKCFLCMGAYQHSQKVYENEHLLCSVEVHPATKEQRDLLFQKMKEAGYEWDTEKKELKKIGQKPTDWEPQAGDIFRKKGTTSPTYHLCCKREDCITFGFVENCEVGSSGGEITLFTLKRDYELVERPKSIKDVVEEEFNKALQTKGEQKTADKYKEWYDFIRWFVKQRTDDYILIPSDDDIHKWGDNILNHARKVLEQKPAWSEKDDINCKRLLYFLNGGNLMQDHKIELFIWMESLKERMQPQPKQEWSEEDAKALNRISTILVDASKVKNWWKEYRLIERDEMIRLTDFLKSLRPQNRWKPSESDILLLEKIANGKSNPQDFQASLWGLIGQLKKLRE